MKWQKRQHRGPDTLMNIDDYSPLFSEILQTVLVHFLLLKLSRNLRKYKNSDVFNLFVRTMFHSRILTLKLN